MAKIIRRGHVPEEATYEYECMRCHSLVEFGKEDRVSDQRDGDYVTCPVCKTYIAWASVVARGKMQPH